jgi:hypothetical protein
MKCMYPEARRQTDAMKAARRRTANYREAARKMGENGIYDWVRFRGQEDARTFASILGACGEGHVTVQKTHRAKFTGDLVWRVEFAISPMTNAYIMRRVGLPLVRMEQRAETSSPTP